MNAIHERAIVGEDVVLGANNTIGPNVVIEDGVVIGSDNIFDPGVIVFKGTTIGDENHFHAGAILGDEPQDLSYSGAETFLKIGNRNRIREYCTIHRGTEAGSSTTIGDETFLMGYTHVAHNCKIGNNVITVNTAVLGGHVEVEDNAFISASVVIHQHVRIGKYSMLSGSSAITQDVPPFMMVGGRIAVAFSLNVVGLKRAGFKPVIRTDIRRAYKLLFRSDLSMTNALAEIENGCVSDEVRDIVNFCRAAKRGVVKGGDADSVR